MNLSNTRAIFNKIKELTGKTPQLSTLRMEQLMDNSKGTYQFSVKQNTGAVLPMEIRLNENDAFYAVAARLRIKNENPTKPGSAQYQSYGNQTAIPVVATETVAEDIESIFNSTLNVKIDQVQTIKALDMSNSRVVPTTQQSAATNRSEIGQLDGFIDLAGVVRFGGSSDIEILLNSPAYVGKLCQQVVLPVRNYVTLEFYGFLVPGGSKLGQLEI